MLPAVMLTLVESKTGEKQSENDKKEKILWLQKHCQFDHAQQHLKMFKWASVAPDEAVQKYFAACLFSVSVFDSRLYPLLL